MHDQSWRQVRALAERVYCPQCHAPVGTTCWVKDPCGKRIPAENFPAHPVRIRKAIKEAK